jgi:hypothetical protein
MRKFKNLMSDLNMTYKIMEREGVVMIYVYDKNEEEYDKIYGNDVETLCQILTKRIKKDVGTGK